MKKKLISERAIIGFDHGLPCHVKNMALGPQLCQKPRPSASVFVYWVPRAMFFTRHGRPWSNPTTQHNNCNDNISVRIALINDTPYLALGMFFVSCTKKNNCNIVRALCFDSNSSLHIVIHMQDTSFLISFISLLLMLKTAPLIRSYYSKWLVKSITQPFDPAIVYQLVSKISNRHPIVPNPSNYDKEHFIAES